MSDGWTTIKMKGKTEEVLSLLSVLLKYDQRNVKYEYNRENDYLYFDFGHVKVYSSKSVVFDNEFIHQENLSEIEEVLRAGFTRVELEMQGPYGRYGCLNQTRIFEEMADAAPNAYFLGGMSMDDNCGGGEFYQGELKKKELMLRYRFYVNDSDEDEEDEVAGDAYYEYLCECLPYERFVELFRIDEDKFDSDEYVLFLYGLLRWEGRSRYRSSSFRRFKKDCRNACQINMDQYREAIDIVNDLDVLGYDDFRKRFDDENTEKSEKESDSEDNWLSIVRYDPVLKSRETIRGYYFGMKGVISFSNTGDQSENVAEYLFSELSRMYLICMGYITDDESDYSDEDKALIRKWIDGLRKNIEIKPIKNGFAIDFTLLDDSCFALDERYLKGNSDRVSYLERSEGMIEEVLQKVIDKYPGMNINGMIDANGRIGKDIETKDGGIFVVDINGNSYFVRENDWD